MGEAPAVVVGAWLVLVWLVVALMWETPRPGVGWGVST
ncbi:hypothetical protein ABIE18_004465 [Arthrobacter sp. 2762]